MQLWAIEREIGSVAPGKCADVIVVDRSGVHQSPDVDPYSTIVYASRSTDVRTTIVDGEVLVDEFVPVRVDRTEVAAAAAGQAQALVRRAGF